ncbi:MAG: hypothetical protein V1735_02765 [Nanoarchaeota archaeon]
MYAFLMSQLERYERHGVVSVPFRELDDSGEISLEELAEIASVGLCWVQRGNRRHGGSREDRGGSAVVIASAAFLSEDKYENNRLDAQSIMDERPAWEGKLPMVFLEPGSQVRAIKVDIDPHYNNNFTWNRLWGPRYVLQKG